MNPNFASALSSSPNFSSVFAASPCSSSSTPPRFETMIVARAIQMNNTAVSYLAACSCFRQQKETCTKLSIRQQQQPQQQQQQHPHQEHDSNHQVRLEHSQKRATDLLRRSLSELKAMFQADPQGSSSVASGAQRAPAAQSSRQAVSPSGAQAAAVAPRCSSKRDFNELSSSSMDASSGASAVRPQPASHVIPEDSSISTFSSGDDEDSSSSLQETDNSANTIVKKPTITSVPLWTEFSQAQQTRGDISSGEQSRDSTAIAMYDRALYINNDDNRPQSQEEVIAVIMYNLALINHNRGLTRGMSGILKRALGLYHMSFQVLLKAKKAAVQEQNQILQAAYCYQQQQQAQQQQPEGFKLYPMNTPPPTVKQPSDLLFLALLNNMSQIQSYFFCNEEMYRDLNMLRHILSRHNCDAELQQVESMNNNCIRSSNRNNDNYYIDKSLTEEEYVWFFVNTLCYYDVGSKALLAIAPAA